MSTPLVLEQVAARLEREAAELRKRAALIRETKIRSRKVARDMAELRRIGAEAAKLATHKRDQLHAASNALAARHGLPAATIEHHARRQLAAQADAIRAARDRSILRMAARGHTNAEIGAQTGLSARQVSRIIAAAYRRPVKG